MLVEFPNSLHHSYFCWPHNDGQLPIIMPKLYKDERRDVVVVAIRRLEFPQIKIYTAATLDWSWVSSERFTSPMARSAGSKGGQRHFANPVTLPTCNPLQWTVFFWKFSGITCYDQMNNYFFSISIQNCLSLLPVLT